MTLDGLAARLLDGTALVIALAGIVAASALAWLAVLVARLMREPRLTTYDVVVPSAETPAPELLLAHLHALMSGSGRRIAGAPPLVLAARGSASCVRLEIAAAAYDVRRLAATLGTIWPGARLVRVRPSASSAVATLEWRPWISDLRQQRPAPGADLTLPRALVRARSDEELAVELVLRPAANVPSRQAAQPQQARSARWSHRPYHRAEAAHDEWGVSGFDCRVRVRAHAATAARAKTLVSEVQPTLHVLCAGTAVRLGVARRCGPSYRFGLTRSRSVLEPRHVAVLLPIGPIAAAVRSSAASPSSEGERLLGVTSHSGPEREVRLSITDSRRHLHVLGPSGTGKSTLLLNLIAQDIAAGRGCAVLDPKGDLVRELLSRIPRSRISDVVYLGPDTTERAVGINPLALGPGEDPYLAVENVLSIFKRIYADNWGPRTDDVLKACLLTLVRTPGTTIAHIPALLSDSSLRRRLTARVDDAVGVGGFWSWYEKLSEARRLEATAPLQNKLRDFLMRPQLRHLLCQQSSTVDLRSLIDRGGILLADLATGRWGETASALAGSFLVARLWQAALARQRQPEHDRHDFLLYIDEFQSFLGIGGPFADALAQARGMRLSLTIANQHLGQLPRELRDATSANAGSRAVFRCAGTDATALAPDFAPLDPEALTALGPYEAAVRLPSSASVLVMRTLAPAPPPTDAAKPRDVIAASSLRFGRDTAALDAALRDALGSTDRSEEPSREPSS